MSSLSSQQEEIEAWVPPGPLETQGTDMANSKTGNDTVIQGPMKVPPKWFRWEGIKADFTFQSPQ